MQGHTGNHFLLSAPFFTSCSACGSSTPSPTKHRQTFTYNQTRGVPPGVCPCTAGSRRQSTCQEAAASLPDNVQAVAACQRLWCGDSEGDLQDFFTHQGVFHHVAVCMCVPFRCQGILFYLGSQYPQATISGTQEKKSIRIEWNLCIEDTIGTQLAVLYRVEPLYRGHHRDPAGCPV